MKKDNKKKKKNKEFSKWLLVQESVLIWITTLALLGLAYLCIVLGYLGTIPWLASLCALPWAAYGVSQVYYYKKALVENSKDGIKYESVMRALDNASPNLSDSNTTVDDPNGDYPDI